MREKTTAVVVTDEDALRACSRLRARFLPAWDGVHSSPVIVELQAVYDELVAIERKAGDPHTALVRMREHLSRRIMPTLDTLRATNGLEAGYAEHVLGEHLKGRS